MNGPGFACMLTPERLFQNRYAALPTRQWVHVALSGVQMAALMSSWCRWPVSPFGLGASDHIRGIENTADFIGRKRLATLASSTGAVFVAVDNNQIASFRFRLIAK